MSKIQQIIDSLNRHQIRATYGAVGQLLGVPAIGVGRLLGNPRAEVSWVVNASSGKPSGYDQSDYHPLLLRKQDVIRNGHDLRKLLGWSEQDPVAREKSVSPSKPAVKVLHNTSPLKPVAKVVRNTNSRNGFQIAGVDLAWVSEKNGSGIAIGTILDNRIELQELHCGVVGLQSVQQILSSQQDLRGVAVDAPLIIKNMKGSRPCEQTLNKVYSVKWAGCHSSNRSNPHLKSTVEFSMWLEGCGFSHLDSSGSGGWQIECYPHPAIIELFGLPQRLKYKKGTLQERRDGQIQLSGYLRSLEQREQLPLHIPGPFSEFLDATHINSLSGSAVKHNEDALDSLICLYVAGLYASGKEMRVFGDPETGYIVVP